MRIEELIKILACPRCKSPCKYNGDLSKVLCTICDGHYIVEENVPIMLDEEGKRDIEHILSQSQGKEMDERWQGQDSPGLKAQLWEYIKPPPHWIDIDKNKIINPLLESSKGLKVLEIGNANKRRTSQTINMDIKRWTNVDVVGKGENLPFMDKTFDVVISEAVLEHVKEPRCMVAEIHRVLSPGGYVYSDAAFMQPYHGYPSHYQNWTLQGFEYLFKDFEKIDSGLVAGPASTLCNVSLKILGLLTDCKYPRFFLYFLFGWLVIFPLKHLDIWLRTKPRAHEIATSVYFVGRKREGMGRG